MGVRVDAGRREAGTGSVHLIATDMEQDRTGQPLDMNTKQQCRHREQTVRRRNQQRERVQVSPAITAARNDGDRCA